MIQSVERAANILKALGGGSRRLGVSELSDQLGLAKGTVHGLLRTLEAHGLVEQDPETDKYQLGATLLRLGNSYLDTSELRSRALRWSERLAENTGESVRVGRAARSRRARRPPRLSSRQQPADPGGRSSAAAPRQRVG